MIQSAESTWQDQIPAGTPVCMVNEQTGEVQPFGGWITKFDSWEVIPGIWQVVIERAPLGQVHQYLTRNVRPAAVPEHVLALFLV
jgi:hypothetical protein